MTEEEFSTLDKPQLLKGAKLCALNADDLFEGALSLEKLENHGAANSLMILSVEEYIKATVLLAGYCNVELGFDVKPIFGNHKSKHDQGARIVPILDLIDVVSGILDKEKSRSESVLEFVNFVLKRASKENQDKIENWWREANNEKNNGFYVGYRNGNWQGPSRILKESYYESKKIVEKFRRISKLLNLINPDDYKLLPVR